MSQPSTEARLVKIETELTYIKEAVGDIKETVEKIRDNHLTHIYQSIEDLKKNQSNLQICFETMQNSRKLNGKEKTLIVTIVTGIAALIAETLRNLMK